MSFLSIYIQAMPQLNGLRQSFWHITQTFYRDLMLGSGFLLPYWFTAFSMKRRWLQLHKYIQLPSLKGRRSCMSNSNIAALLTNAWQHLCSAHSQQQKLSMHNP